MSALTLLMAAACSGGDDTAVDSADTDTDTDTPPNDSDIAKVQRGEYAVDEVVTVTGLVAHDEIDAGFYLLDGHGGPHSGIWVYKGSELATGLSRGDEITLTGTVAEYAGSTGGEGTLTELILGAVEDVTVVSSANPLPEASELTATELGDPEVLESYEGVLVALVDPEIVETELGFGEWRVQTPDGGKLRIDDQLYGYTGGLVEEATFDRITGLLNFSYDDYKLEPRDADDFVGYDFEGPECTADRCTADLVEGDLVLTEVMANPSIDCVDDTCEWLELYNPSAGTVDLNGLVLEDGSGRQDALRVSVVVQARSYVVLGGRDAETWSQPAFTPDAYWGDHFQLTNGGSSVELLVPSTGVSVDAISYPAAAAAGGYSWQLTSTVTDATGNDDSDNWCIGTSRIGASNDSGTPGQPNAECAVEGDTGGTGR